MVWYGMVRYGMVWYGVWYGMVWYGMVVVVVVVQQFFYSGLLSLCKWDRSGTRPRRSSSAPRSVRPPWLYRPHRQGPLAESAT
jgi:hypothetical protein